MATPSHSDQLSNNESADLQDRVERFRGAWKKDGSTGLGRYIPPPGTRHRTAALVQVIVADMSLRAAVGLPFDVESYVNRFPDELSGDALPLELLVTEYQMRHRFGDKPNPEEYRARFPARYDEFSRHLAQPPAPVTPPRNTPGTKGPQTTSTMNGPPGAKSRRVGDLVGTHAEHTDAPLPVRTGGSTILPSDAPYQLVRLLGSGAFGEVFEALAPGGVRVAVKRIMRSVDHPASKAEREALEAIKELSHPFLLKTNAYWVFDDRLIIVMEMADGSLAGRVEHHQSQGRIGVPPEELIPLFEQAGEALDYLHTQNISHRDIKPENILLLKGYAKVADFGLARSQEHTLTVVGNTVGTPAYMAPEMWQQKVSLHSDQYSLAATYVRVRLGRPLFDTTVLIEMANFHVYETPDLDPLPAAEQDVLHRALAKEPDERFPTCLEFVKALRAAVLAPTGTAEHTPTKPPGGTKSHSIFPPKVKPKRESGNLWLVIGVAVAVALAVGVVNRLLPPSAPSTAPSQVRPVEVATGGNKEKEKEKAAPEIQRPVYPTGWEPDESAGTHVVGDKHFHKRLTRSVAGEVLVAVLVHQTRPNGPPYEFYVLQNKVTNRVFAHTWGFATKSQAAAVAQLEKNFPDYLSKAWQKGAMNFDEGKELGIEGRQAGVPVVGVTLPQAMLVAEELGGQLPTLLEWKKATGALGDDPRRLGPAGEGLTVPKELEGPDQRPKRAEFIRDAMSDRNLALGLTRGPWPVDRQTADVSEPWKVHQLVSNGQEWTREGISGQLFTLSNIPDRFREAVVVGRGANDLTVSTFETILGPPGSQEWGATESATGFRVVLRPR